MADRVQEAREAMLPEILDYRKHELFTEDELRKIIAERTNFEYKLVRRAPAVADFQRYLAFEQQLARLRALRKKEHGIRKRIRADIEGEKRTHRIFDVMLRKFKAEESLWLQYMEYCRSHGAKRALGRASARAIQHHPRNVAFWINAASYEFEHNRNVEAARALLQRALRINSDTPDLWIEYFRLELLYVQKIAMRRRVLQISEQETGEASTSREAAGSDASRGSGDDNGAASSDGSDDEADSDSSDNEDEKLREYAEPSRSGSRASSTMEDFLRCAIPRVVFSKAVQECTMDTSCVIRFLSCIDEVNEFYPIDTNVLEDTIYAYLLNHSGHVAHTRAELYLRSVRGVLSTSERCVALRSAAEDLWRARATFTQGHACWSMAWLAVESSRSFTEFQSDDERHEVSACLTDIANIVGRNFMASLDGGEPRASDIGAILELLCGVGDLDSARTVLHAILSRASDPDASLPPASLSYAGSVVPTILPLSDAYAYLCDSVTALGNRAARCQTSSALGPFASAMIALSAQAVLVGAVSNHDNTLKNAIQHIRHVVVRKAVHHCVVEDLDSWHHLCQGTRELLRHAAPAVAAHSIGQLLSGTMVAAEVYLVALHYYREAAESSCLRKEDVNRVRRISTAACEAHGSEHIDVWVERVRIELALGNRQRAADISQQALRSYKNPQEWTVQFVMITRGRLG